MENIGFYINPSIQNLKFVENFISKKNLDTESKIYSNALIPKTNLFKEETSFYANIYNEVNDQIDELSKTFYSQYSNTPICNHHFNFWIYLRFNSLQTLLNFNKIKAWINEMVLQKNVSHFYIFGLDSKTQNLLKFHFKNVHFYSEKKVKNNDYKKIGFNLFRILVNGIKSSFKSVNVKDKTLFVSRKISFSKLLTKVGVIKEDKYIYNILSELKPDAFERILDTNLLSKKNLLNYSFDSINKKFNLNAERLLVKALLKPSFYYKIIMAHSFVNKILKNEKSFLGVLIKNNKAGVVTELMIYWMYHYFFKKSGIKNLVLNDEMSPGSNSIVRAAKYYNINTIGIQHGILNKNNLAYNFTNFELTKDNPFPNKLVVWGNDERIFFQKNDKFLKDIITPLGNVLFDSCKYLKPKKNNKFTVLFATQPQPIVEQRLKSIADFVAAINKFKPSEIKVIVRLHPRELSDYSIYDDYFSKLSLYDFTIDKGNEIFSQLNEIDVLVTSFSTVAKDVMLLNKPIILMDYYGKDNTGLITKGVAFNAVNTIDLYKLLFSIKNKNKVINADIYKIALNNTFINTGFNTGKNIVKLLV